MLWLVISPTPPDRTLQVAHIGAFSMPNWGDQLYPPLLRSLLAEVGLAAQTDLYAPVEGVTHDGRSIRHSSLVQTSGADAAVVGGGDILRFDTLTVAMDHMSIPSSKREGRVVYARAKRFARRRFSPGPGVWVPKSAWLPDKPSVLVSAGVHPVPERARAAVSRFNAAWVRNSDGAHRLAEAGVPRHAITIAPDMVFALDELREQRETRARGERLLQQRVGGDDLPVLFHAAEFHGWPLDRVVAALKQLRGLPVATLSLGSYAGEDDLLRQASERVGIPTLDDLVAPEVTAVLAAAGAVFTTSMHAAIVGASFGTPVIVPGVGKTRDAFAVLPEPPTLFAADVAGLRSTVTEVLGSRLAHSTERNRGSVVAAITSTLHTAGLV